MQGVLNILPAPRTPSRVVNAVPCLHLITAAIKSWNDSIIECCKEHGYLLLTVHRDTPNSGVPPLPWCKVRTLRVIKWSPCVDIVRRERGSIHVPQRTNSNRDERSDPHYCLRRPLTRNVNAGMRWLIRWPECCKIWQTPLTHLRESPSSAEI